MVDAIYEQVSAILREAKISYIKWDMNRSITECYSSAWPADRQGEIYHRYILGVYDLYDRLTKEFPQVLFESCASGGGTTPVCSLRGAPAAAGGLTRECSITRLRAGQAMIRMRWKG